MSESDIAFKRKKLMAFVKFHNKIIAYKYTLIAVEQIGDTEVEYLVFSVNKLTKNNLC